MAAVGELWALMLDVVHHGVVQVIQFYKDSELGAIRGGTTDLLWRCDTSCYGIIIDDMM